MDNFLPQASTSNSPSPMHDPASPSRRQRRRLRRNAAQPPPEQHQVHPNPNYSPNRPNPFHQNNDRRMPRRNNNSYSRFPQPQCEMRSETIEELDRAAMSAHRDLLASKENVSVWKVSQAALLMVKAESWESLGFRIQQVPSLKHLLVTEGKANSFIHCFVAVRRICSLYDLEVAICKSEGIEHFEELELGPLARHPLAVHYFSLTSDVMEAHKISTEQIICYLCEFLDTHKWKEVNVDAFLDFMAMKQSVDSKEKLCVRIQAFGLYIKYIQASRQLENTVLRDFAKREQKMRQLLLSSAKNKQLELDDRFISISQQTKSSLENKQFCAKHMRHIASSSEMNDSDNNEYDEHQDEKTKRRSCSGSLPNVTSDHVCTCPYPSAAEEMTRLGLAIEEHCRSGTHSGDVRCSGDNEQSQKHMGLGNQGSHHSLADESLRVFVTNWKETCQKNNADEVLERMLQFCKPKKRRRVKALFTKDPCVGLLNVAVTSLKFGIWDNIYESYQAFNQTTVDGKKIESPADFTSIDFKADSLKKKVDLIADNKDLAVLAQRTLTREHGFSAEDIVNKISGYFRDDIFSHKNFSRENKFLFLRELCKCEYWLIEEYSIKEFESLGYGEYFMFLEKYMHLLPHTLQKCLVGDIYEKDFLEAHLLPLQFGVLLSQALNSSWEDEIINLQHVSDLLARQFPLVRFNLVKSGLMENFTDILREMRFKPTSNCLLFSASLLRLHSVGDSLGQNEEKMEETCGDDVNTGSGEAIVSAVTAKDAIETFLKAPMLIDLNLWSHWDLLFAPSLGSIVEWLLNEVNTEELLCLVTTDGKIIRIDHLATTNSFLEVCTRRSAFETALKLLSLFALYGGQRNVPLSLLKCHARQAFEVNINNLLEMELHNKKNPPMHGKPSCNQYIAGANTPCNLASNLPYDRDMLSKVVTVMSSFILDCLSYLPVEFCSLAADVLISGLQSFIKDVPSAILSECKQIPQRLMLHQVGISLGIVEWVNDYHSFSAAATTEFLPGSSCLDFLNTELNTRSMNMQGVLIKHPASSEEMPVSSGAHCPDDSYKQSNSGYDSAEIAVDDYAAISKLSNSPNPINDDPVRVIESIRKEEFGLEKSLSDAENRMLEKQHARLGRALQCLSQELYSQDSHFLLELVQNADDNVYPENVEPTLMFILQEKNIIVLNNEQGFLANNIRALCDVGNSTKKGHSAGYIGKKGIGFKSVFRVTDAPQIHSNGFHIKFDITRGQIGFVLPTIVPPCDIELYTRLASAGNYHINQNAWNTCIVLPFRSRFSEGFAMNNVLSMFSDLHPSMLLFLHRLQCIKFRNMLDDSLTVMRKEVIGDGIVQVALGTAKMTWFVVSQKLQADVIHSDVQTTEISVAFTLKETSAGGFDPILIEQPVFAFLPLRAYGLKFILQGDFVLPSSREEVDGNSPWNQWLLSQFPDLFVSAEGSFCDLPCYTGSPGKAVTAFMSFIPLIGEAHGFFSSLPRLIISKLRVSNCLLLESEHIEWVPPCKVLRNWTDQTRSLLPDSLLHEHVGLGFLNKDIVLSNSLARALGVEEYGPKVLLKVISSLCRSQNSLKSMDLSWLCSWLNAIYLMSSHSSLPTSPSFGTESDFIFKLQKVPFIPLSDGKYGSVDGHSIWLHYDVVDQGISGPFLLEAFPKLYAKLEMVSLNLFAAAASIENSCSETNVLENVTRMLYKLGVRKLSAHEILKVHVLPAISVAKSAIGQEELMIEYLSFAMFHLQSSCTTCGQERSGIIRELHEKALILTNHGYRRSNEVPIHFNREFGSPVDADKLISGLDVKWHEIDSIYVQHPVTKSLSGGMLTWRIFFQEIGVTDFVQILQVEKSTADMSPVNIKDIMWGNGMISMNSVARNWESEELFHLLSCLSSSNDGDKSKYLLEILDRLWDDYFSDKTTGYCVDSTGECKSFKSSLVSILQDIPWISSSMDNELHYPKDLFQDCLAVNSILGISAPYPIPKVRSEKLLADIGLKTQVILDDALSVLRVWRRCESSFKASVSQISNFYTFLWKGMTLSKSKIIEALHSGPFIFVPHTYDCSHEENVDGALLSLQEVYWHDSTCSVDQMNLVDPECVPGMASRPLRKVLSIFYPNLHDFFVNECGVDESPPLCSYLHILLQLSTIALPHQAAKRVFEVFLKWADALESGLLSLEDVEYLKENLLKKEYSVLPTSHDKWVSLHASFGLICRCDNDNLGREFKQATGVDFLNFGDFTDEENKMIQAKVSTIMQRLGIPTLSEIVTREPIYYGPADSNFIFSLMNWILPYAQRYILNAYPDKYVQLKQSGFVNIRSLKIVVVEKLFYRNVIKRSNITSNKRHDCNCLLQDNVLYCSQGSDPHSIFLEFSRLLCDGDPVLDFANFLHIITTMAESGATEERTEFFIVNSQKVRKLPAEESCWSFDSLSLAVESHAMLAENFLQKRAKELNSSKFTRKTGVNPNRPPEDWKTAPGFRSGNALRLKKPAARSLQITEGNVVNKSLEQTGVVAAEIISELSIDDGRGPRGPTVTSTEVLRDAKTLECRPTVSMNVVPDDGRGPTVNSTEVLRDAILECQPTISMNVVPDSVDLVGTESINFERDRIPAEQALLTGRLGEMAAFEYFSVKVGDVFVKWVNEAEETGLPYDIIIGSDEVSREYIEVKATKYEGKNWFLISTREWQFAIEKGKSYSIAHVDLSDNNRGKVTIYKDPARLCQLGNMKLAVVMPKQ